MISRGQFQPQLSCDSVKTCLSIDFVSVCFWHSLVTCTIYEQTLRTRSVLTCSHVKTPTFELITFTSCYPSLTFTTRRHTVRFYPENHETLELFPFHIHWSYETVQWFQIIICHSHSCHFSPN